MVFALGTKGGNKIMVLGLSEGNIKRLKHGDPMSISAETHPGFPTDLNIIIMYGQTEAAIVSAFSSLIDEDTKLIQIPRKDTVV